MTTARVDPVFGGGGGAASGFSTLASAGGCAGSDRSDIVGIGDTVAGDCPETARKGVGSLA
jgi:hypothetical protein